MLRQRKQLAAAVAKGSVHVGLEHCPRKRQPPAVWMQAWLAFACMGGSIHLATRIRGRSPIASDFNLSLATLSNRTMAPCPPQRRQSKVVRRDHNIVRASPLLPIVHTSPERRSEADRCYRLLAGRPE